MMEKVSWTDDVKKETLRNVRIQKKKDKDRLTVTSCNARCTDVYTDRPARRLLPSYCGSHRCTYVRHPSTHIKQPHSSGKWMPTSTTQNSAYKDKFMNLTSGHVQQMVTRENIYIYFTCITKYSLTEKLLNA